MRRWLEFPNPVNDKAARVVATIVLVTGIVVLATGWLWLLPVMAIGFALRVAFGPRLSPAALLATRVVAPRLGEPSYTPGPPKRFAQGIGLVVTGAASIAAYTPGGEPVAYALTGLIIAAATLEAAFAVCIGCKAFAVLMRLGLVPSRVCLSCASEYRGG